MTGGKYVHNMEYTPRPPVVDMLWDVEQAVPTNATVYMRPSYGQMSDAAQASTLSIKTDERFVLPEAVTGSLAGSWFIERPDGTYVEIPEGNYAVLLQGDGNVTL